MKTRKKYSKEFKLDAISLVVEQSYSVAEAAKSLGINPGNHGRWIKEQGFEGEQAFRGNGNLPLSCISKNELLDVILTADTFNLTHRP